MLEFYVQKPFLPPSLPPSLLHDHARATPDGTREAGEEGGAEVRRK